MKTILFISACILLCSEPSLAVTARDSTDTIKQPPEIYFLSKSDDTPLYEISLWGGYSFNSVTLWGKTTDATLGTLGFSLKRKFLKIHNTTIEYLTGFHLYARYTYPEFNIDRQRTSLSGFGITPVGLQTNFFANRKIQPFLNTSVGLMFLEEPFPDSRGEKRNFTLSLGTGLEFVIAGNTNLSLGYKYLHLSNGDLGEVNPGIDSSLLYTSITFNL